MVDTITALRQMAKCRPADQTVAALDSALREGLLDRSRLRELRDSLPARLHHIVDRADARSESIVESLLRYRLQELELHFELQVTLPGVGRVDFLVESRLVIEVDGWAYHGDRDAFEEDRRRDAVLAALDRRVLRFTYRQVTQGWMQVRRAILAALDVPSAGRLP
ncbi:endonuclease domain-containing protein [Herbiconiux sp. SYSU D00978]|uniref:endonuclease domain-containing protein n=1 Tax=Herbiconiux sp. SYSU D00978 TaxID=2812562 RepID=UPI001A9789C8|nr:DUF559 domain-containing protein [Herbiconiux sp. SYSU D00978]